MKLTHDLVESCRSDRGGFTHEVARILGAEFPLTEGWPRRLAGKEISTETFMAARAARNSRMVNSQEPWTKRSAGQLAMQL